MLKMGLFRDFACSTYFASYFVDPLAPFNVIVWKMFVPCLKIDHCGGFAIEWRWTGPGGNKSIKHWPPVRGHLFLKAKRFHKCSKDMLLFHQKIILKLCSSLTEKIWISCKCQYLGGAPSHVDLDDFIKLTSCSDLFGHFLFEIRSIVDFESESGDLCVEKAGIKLAPLCFIIEMGAGIFSKSW